MSDIPASSDHAPSAPDPRRNRSRVTNGSAFPSGIDGRSAEARRWKDLYALYKEAHGKPPGAAADACIRALATVTLRIELISTGAAQGATVDDAVLVSLINTQGRLMQALGIAPTSPEPQRSDPLARYRELTGINV